MQKTRLSVLILTLMSLAAWTATAKPTQQNNFGSFWKKFKTAVKNQDVNTIADLTKFPFPIYDPINTEPTLKSRNDFIKEYKDILNNEANTTRCFEKNKPKRRDAKSYEIYCNFAKEPETEGPIVFHFNLTKTGWKFIHTDNINE